MDDAGATVTVGARAEAQVRQTEIAKELEEMRQHPEAEQREMAALLVHEGIATDGIVAALVRYPDAYRKTMVEKELGLQMEASTVKLPEALTMYVSYIVSSIFPLAPSV